MNPLTHVLDFEGSCQRGISEWGVVSLRDQDIVATQTQSYPKDPINGKVFQNFRQNSAYFLAIRRTGLFCAHFSRIEDALLRLYWASPGFVPRFTSCRSVTSWGPWLDTCRLWARLAPGLTSYSLIDLMRHCGLENELKQEAAFYCATSYRHYHTALYDALAASLLWRLAQRLVPRKTLEDWLFYSGFE